MIVIFWLQKYLLRNCILKFCKSFCNKLFILNSSTTIITNPRSPSPADIPYLEGNLRFIVVLVLLGKVHERRRSVPVLVHGGHFFPSGHSLQRYSTTTTHNFETVQKNFQRLPFAIFSTKLFQSLFSILFNTFWSTGSTNRFAVNPASNWPTDPDRVVNLRGWSTK